VAAAGVNIRMISQGASEINISFVIREEDVARAITKLHTHFFPKELAREEHEDAVAEAAAAGSRTENGSSQRRVPRLITAREQ
jgi:aspartate kinase